MNFHEEFNIYRMSPIGIIHSPFRKTSMTPIQSSRSNTIGTVEVFQDYTDGLVDIDEFSHIYLIYVFHKYEGYNLKVKPFLDNEMHGLFSTRHPSRPNPIGISIEKLLTRENNMLSIEGVDMLDGTPLLDIKPYIPDFDIRSNVKTGWYHNRYFE